MVKTQQSAKNKLMDYLARRDHSEKELRTKLGRFYSEEEVNEAIEAALASNLLVEPALLSSKVASALQRKKKSHRYIQEFLKKKGLPPVSRQDEVELEKAREIVRDKFRKSPPFSYEEKPKVFRYLSYRGFDGDVIRKVMNERE